MKLKSILKNIVLIFVFNLIYILSWAQAIKDIPVFEDDPIASMLDSLALENYFEKALAKPKTNKFKFAPDSIPVYEEAVYESRLAKIDAETPFSLEYNPSVKNYIELYSKRKRALVSRVIGMSQLYFPMIEQMLDKYNIPLEMKYLAIVESAMNPRVRSRAGAMGLWQFMYGTGKMYNLKVTSYVDERCDPYKATQAACEYLRFLYDMFGDWEMVLAAYNSGPGTVNKAIRRSGGKNTYWEIRPYLPRETQGYVPAFIAVNYVMRYSSEHNLYSSVPKRAFFEVDTVKVKQQISFEQISAVLDIPIDEVRFLNPQYKKDIIPYSANDPYALCLPTDKIGSFVTNEQAIYNYLKKENPTSQDILAIQEVKRVHTVRRGEHLSLIANRYKCTIYDLKQWNNLKSNSLRAGQKLTVYINKLPSSETQSVLTKEPPAKSKVENDKSSSNQNTSDSKYYTIKNGDTLWEIAQKAGTTMEEIKRLNNFGAKHILHPGDKIRLE